MENKQKVYCVVEFDSLDCENLHEILGVYTSKDIALKAVKNQIEFLKKDLRNDYIVMDEEDCDIDNYFSFDDIESKTLQELCACKIARMTLVDSEYDIPCFALFIITEIEIPDNVKVGDKIYPVFEQCYMPFYQFRLVNFIGVDEKDAENFIGCENCDCIHGIEKDFFGNVGRILPEDDEYYNNFGYDTTICTENGWFIGWAIWEYTLSDKAE